MTRARMPRPHEIDAAKRDPRLLRAFHERQDDGAWRTRGVCQSVDPEMFFPAPSEPADTAVALCRGCEVQGACLAWALDVGDCHGVWGATTPRERRAMLVAWRSAVGTGDPAEPEVPVPLTVAARALPSGGPLTAAGPATAARPVPVRIGRRLGLVPEPRSGRPVDRSRTEGDLVERVAS
jgi:WhiB family transcriptional regulator, redox-sensing transcriptional regulator